MFTKVTKLFSKQKITIKVDPVLNDPYKQSELLKAACGSKSDLAALLYTKDIDINQHDNQGRTALHFAAAVNNVDAVELLLKNNAKIDKKTLSDGQSAIHHAVKHNATRTLIYLCENGANIQLQDHRLRTPLFLAAEYDPAAPTPSLELYPLFTSQTRENLQMLGQQESAKILLDYGADIKSLDSSGQSILSLMMVNMPSMAEEGLNQLYSYNPDTLKSQYYIKHLEPIYNNKLKRECSRRSIQFIVWFKLNNLTSHPVVKKFVDVKWKIYGHMEALTLLAANTIFIVSWCSFLYLFAMERSRFTDLKKVLWKLLLALFCFVELIYLIILDMHEYFEIRYLFHHWQQQQQESLENDVKFCSPALPQEEAFLKKRLEKLIKMEPFYRLTYWRLINWILYVVLLLVFFLLTRNMVFRRETLGNLDQQLAAIIIIPLWLCGLKYYQVLSFIGPFVLMLHKIITPVLKYLFLHSEIFIAFTMAFWIIFGGIIEHVRTFHSLIFTILQVTIPHHYGYAEFHDIDPLMTYILVCLLIIGSIFCKNILVAMLTEALSGIQDEISSQIVMERLAVLVQRDNSFLFYFDHQAAHHFIYKLCGPLTILDCEHTTISFLNRTLMIITKHLHDIEVFLKTRMLDFKGIGGILKRKEEEQNLITIEHNVNVLQKKLMEMASLREKKNQLLFLQLQLIYCLLKRMKVSTEPTTSNQKD